MSDDHIREFCAAIWALPPFHPPEVRDWHDPAKLDADRFDLHRRRSIHVHCWSAEDMASTIVGLVLLGLLHVQLLDVSFHDDGDEGAEYGLLLERIEPGVPLSMARAFATTWTELVLDHGRRDPERCATFVAALARDLASVDRLEPTLVGLPANVLGGRLREQQRRRRAPERGAGRDPRRGRRPRSEPSAQGRPGGHRTPSLRAERAAR